MSLLFAGIRLFNFTGTTNRLPVKLPQGVVPPRNQVPPSVCPVSINWLPMWVADGSTATRLGVTVNLQAASVQSSILDRIASVKIDNTGSDCSIYVEFPDTGDVINCPPNCSVTYPCLTNNLVANIYAIGLLATFIPRTKLFFYNISLPPSNDFEISQAIELWRASPVIPRGDFANTRLGPPALGDQIATAVCDLTTATNSIVIPHIASGRLYITSIYVAVAYLVNNAGTAFGLANVQQQFTANLLVSVPWAAPAAANFDFRTQVLYQQSGMNLNLDATLDVLYHNNTGITAGVAHTIITYTQQP